MEGGEGPSVLTLYMTSLLVLWVLGVPPTQLSVLHLMFLSLFAFLPLPRPLPRSPPSVSGKGWRL
jgi:hypothetical protein